MLKEGSFDAAVKGAHFVFHTASPFFRCASVMCYPCYLSRAAFTPNAVLYCLPDKQAGYVVCAALLMTVYTLFEMMPVFLLCTSFMETSRGMWV